MNVLLVGSSFALMPALKFLKGRGFNVHVCSSRPNEPCALIADSFYEADYSDLTLLDAIIAKNKYSAIIPDCNDRAYYSCALLAYKYGFLGFDLPEVVNKIHNKADLRNLLSFLQIRAPQYVLLDNFKELKMDSLKLPLIVKPSEGYSGIGITKVEDISELGAAIKKAFGVVKKSIVIEEFIEGELYSHSAFIRGGNIVDNFFVDEFCTLNPFQVNTSNISNSLSIDLRRKIESDVLKIVQHLKLVDGIFHTQFIVDENGLHYFIECTRRCPGDMYYKLIEYSTGFDYFKNYLAPFIFISHEYNDKKDELIKPIIRHTISLSTDSNFIGIEINSSHKKLNYIPIKSSGDLVLGAPRGRFGIIFIEFNSWHELIKARKLISNCIRILDY